MKKRVLRKALARKSIKTYAFVDASNIIYGEKTVLRMKTKSSILHVGASRVGHIASTYLYLAGVQGNGQSGITHTPCIGVMGGSVINSAF